MEAIVARSCGLDVHQAMVVACLLIGEPHQKPKRIVKTFRTVTQDLRALRDWLLGEGCTHVGMESTGVYWMPVYAVLEGSFELIVGNAQHMRNVPGRKTDVKDSEWIADLVRHGLVAKSFVPSPPLRELRDLTRYRRKLVESRTAERNRLIRVLETANIKLSSVASDVFGVSGMLMLRALIAGTATPRDMAALAKGQLRKKLADLELALEGCVQEHHRFLLGMQLARVESVESDLTKLDERITAKIEPYKAQQEMLIQIPGVDRNIATVIIAEIGVDMSVFKSARHLAAWAGASPGNNESAGRKKKGTTRKGNVHLLTALVTAAIAASKKKGSYYKTKFHRLKSRRGAMRAAVAIGHKILIAAYHMLSSGRAYQELGEEYLDARARHQVTDNLVRRLEHLGYEVKIEPKAA